jgi:hypothetical protein
MKAELLQRDRMDFDDGAILLRSKEALITTSSGSSTVTLENDLSDTTTIAQRAILGALANRRTDTFLQMETLVGDFLDDVSRQRSADEKGNDPNPPR